MKFLALNLVSRHINGVFTLCHPVYNQDKKLVWKLGENVAEYVTFFFHPLMRHIPCFL
jgi:hypothetical protein